MRCHFLNSQKWLLLRYRFMLSLLVGDLPKRRLHHSLQDVLVSPNTVMNCLTVAVSTKGHSPWDIMTRTNSTHPILRRAPPCITLSALLRSSVRRAYNVFFPLSVCLCPSGGHVRSVLSDPCIFVLLLRPQPSLFALRSDASDRRHWRHRVLLALAGVVTLFTPCDFRPSAALHDVMSACECLAAPPVFQLPPPPDLSLVWHLISDEPYEAVSPTFSVLHSFLI